MICELNGDVARKLARWANDHRGAIEERYGVPAFVEAVSVIGLTGFLKSLPPDTPLFSPGENGAPMTATAIRADGERWDLKLPIKANRLFRASRYYSERDVAERLGISRAHLKRMQERAQETGYPLDAQWKQSIAAETMGYIAYGDRFRKKPEE